MILEDLDMVTDSILDEEPPCEFEHRETTCDMHVSTAVRACDGGGNVCSTATIRIEEWMTLGIKCAKCKKYAADCWRLIPI